MAGLKDEVSADLRESEKVEKLEKLWEYLKVEKLADY